MKVSVYYCIFCYARCYPNQPLPPKNMIVKSQSVCSSCLNLDNDQRDKLKNANSDRRKRYEE